MKHIKLFENFENSTFVGYHCSPSEIKDDFYGKIESDYYTSFVYVLGALKDDYPEAKVFFDEISMIDDFPMVAHDTNILDDVEYFFNENNIEWIYVNKAEPLTNYGSNCYEVYFDNFNDVYPMVDELVDGADIYLYNASKNKPVLKRHEY